MIFIWFLRWLNSSNFLTGIIVTWSPREINPIALSSSSQQQMLDWLHFYFNLCPISYVATDLISSQYSDCVFSSLHPDAHQMVRVEPGPNASLTSFFSLLETKIAPCQDVTTFWSFSVCLPGKLDPRVSPVWGLAPLPLVAGVSSEPDHQSESASQRESRHQTAVRHQAQGPGQAIIWGLSVTIGSLRLAEKKSQSCSVWIHKIKDNIQDSSSLGSLINGLEKRFNPKILFGLSLDY